MLAQTLLLALTSCSIPHFYFSPDDTLTRCPRFCIPRNGRIPAKEQEIEILTQPSLDSSYSFRHIIAILHYYFIHHRLILIYSSARITYTPRAYKLIASVFTNFMLPQLASSLQIKLHTSLLYLTRIIDCKIIASHNSPFLLQPCSSDISSFLRFTLPASPFKICLHTPLTPSYLNMRPLTKQLPRTSSPSLIILLNSRQITPQHCSTSYYHISPSSSHESSPNYISTHPLTPTNNIHYSDPTNDLHLLVTSPPTPLKYSQLPYSRTLLHIIHLAPVKTSYSVYNHHIPYPRSIPLKIQTYSTQSSPHNHTYLLIINPHLLKSPKSNPSEILNFPYLIYQISHINRPLASFQPLTVYLPPAANHSPPVQSHQHLRPDLFPSQLHTMHTQSTIKISLPINFEITKDLIHITISPPCIYHIIFTLNLTAPPSQNSVLQIIPRPSLCRHSLDCPDHKKFKTLHTVNSTLAPHEPHSFTKILLYSPIQYHPHHTPPLTPSFTSHQSILKIASPTLNSYITTQPSKHTTFI